MKRDLTFVNYHLTVCLHKLSWYEIAMTIEPYFEHS